MRKIPANPLKRRPQLIVTTALLFSISIGVGLASCTSDDSTAPSTPSAQSPSTAATAAESGSKLGKPVTVGSFTYTIESVKNVGKKLSSDEGESLAQGEFVVVKMTVKNNGTAPANVLAANFTATTSGGQSVVAQENDSIIANGTNPAFREGIVAGQTQPVSLVFDFSPATKSPVTQILINDGGQSVSVKVA